MVLFWRSSERNLNDSLAQCTWKLCTFALSQSVDSSLTRTFTQTVVELWIPDPRVRCSSHLRVIHSFFDFGRWRCIELMLFPFVPVHILGSQVTILWDLLQQCNCNTYQQFNAHPTSFSKKLRLIIVR